MGIFVVGTGKFPIMDPTDPQKNAPTFVNESSPWSVHSGRPWHERYMYNWIALFMIRFKYYFAWKNAEGSNNIWYAGFEGFDENGEPIGWENANNIDIFQFEVRLMRSEWWLE